MLRFSNHMLGGILVAFGGVVCFFLKSMKVVVESETVCYISDSAYFPYDMAGTDWTSESSAADCQMRCHSVTGCAHFAWLSDGSCHIQDSSSSPVTGFEDVTTGPPTCVQATTAGPWVKGSEGAVCNAVCSALGLSCNSSLPATLRDWTLVKNAFGSAGFTCQNEHSARSYPGTPFSKGTDCAPWNGGSEISCTGNQYSDHAPLCYCEATPTTTTTTTTQACLTASLNPPETDRTYSRINVNAESMLDSDTCWKTTTYGGDWMQIDLGSLKVVGGVATQGGCGKVHYVNKFTVKASSDGSAWWDIKGEFSMQPADKNSTWHHRIIARYLRLMPTGWNGAPAMRAGVLTCSWAGQCNNGQLRALEERTSDNQCGSCHDGYYLTGTVCKSKVEGCKECCESGSHPANCKRGCEDGDYLVKHEDCLRGKGVLPPEG